MALLEVNDLSMDFGGLKALDHLTLQVEGGEIFGLIGPNGSGKTTCFNVITGFLKPTAGSVIYRGKPITGLEPYEVARRGIIKTFQLIRLFPNLTAEENIIIGRHLRTQGDLWGAIFRSRNYRNEQAQLREKARKLLSFVGMDERRDVIAKNLPLGDERRLEIAVALAGEPDLLLLDEPASGMSPKESDTLVDLIRSIQKMGTTVVIVEHNMRVVMELCDTIAVLSYGVKIAQGTPDEIANNEDVISVYLGQENHNAEC
jgi:branched-chain amino acid transport system ATP-binding protein